MAAVLFFASTKRNSARWLLLSLFFAGNFNLPPAAAAYYWSWTTLGWSPARGILCFDWSLLWSIALILIIDLLSRLKMCVLGAMFIKLISLFLCMYFNISITFACNRCSSVYNKCSQHLQAYHIKCETCWTFVGILLFWYWGLEWHYDETNSWNSSCCNPVRNTCLVVLFYILIWLDSISTCPVSTNSFLISWCMNIPNRLLLQLKQLEW